MTPKEKANVLVDLFSFDLRPFSERGDWNPDVSKKCAMVCVDEIRNSHKELTNGIEAGEKYLIIEAYWNEVKTEIEKL